jgi:outer membrane protein OmpA-like peptidoglycan-associated protein
MNRANREFSHLLSLSTWIPIAALALLAACAPNRDRRTDPDPYRTTDARGARGAEITVRDQPMGERTQWEATDTDRPQWRITAVVIDVGLAELCGIDKADAHFEYDSAELDAESKATISALTDCFVDGPLAGRDVVLVGHADPRGPDDYNRELGMSRAEAVAQQMIREGLASGRIGVESHGEEHAHADPGEWPDNRRVDVLIAR